MLEAFSHGSVLLITSGSVHVQMDCIDTFAGGLILGACTQPASCTSQKFIPHKGRCLTKRMEELRFAWLCLALHATTENGIMQAADPLVHPRAPHPASDCGFHITPYTCASQTAHVYCCTETV